MPALANEKHEVFCQHYMTCFNQAEAARRAGYSEKTARQQGSRLLTNADIQKRLTELRNDMADRLEVEKDTVFRRWWDTANADPSELTQLRIGPCRYCWGEGHQYQWKTVREFDEVQREWFARTPADDASEIAKKLHASEEPSDAGGYGYRLSRDVNPDCPECAGIGERYTWIPDTRTIGPEAKLLFRGVKETKHGVEVLMADVDKNLELVARRLGMLKETVEHDVSDPIAKLLTDIGSKGSMAPLKSEEEDG